MKIPALLAFLALTGGCSAQQMGTFFGALNAMSEGAARNADLATTTASLVDGKVPPPGYYAPVQQTTVYQQAPAPAPRPRIVPPPAPQPVPGPAFRPLSY